MKHYDEYYTCDRCGKKIDDNSFFWFPIQRTKVFKLSTMCLPEIKSYISGQNVEKLPDDKVAVEITEYRDRRYKEYHLCPKCRKEFERFMKNEYERG